ncbi:MAG TPA: Ig domain-containing protein [Atribacterota bacterium]|nr:Ig domain-containing protein [Atribacterota bacterium]
MKQKHFCPLIVMVVLLTSFMVGVYVLSILANELTENLPETELKAISGIPLNYQLVLNDSNPKLIFVLRDAPEGMTIDRKTGMVEWTPTQEQIGVHKASIVVTDGSNKDKQELTITVVSSGLSSIVAIPAVMDIEGVNITKKIESVTAYYSDGSSKVIDKTKCHFQSDKTNIITVNERGIVETKNIGTATITVSYSEEGIAKNSTITVTVKLPTLPFFGGG